MASSALTSASSVATEIRSWLACSSRRSATRSATSSLSHWLICWPSSSVCRRCERALDGAAEVGEVDRLDEVVERAALHAERGGGRVVDGGEHQERDASGSSSMIRGTRSMPLVPGRFTSSSMPVIFCRRRIAERLLAGGRDDDLVPLLDEILPDGVADRLLVVHDEQGDGAIRSGTRGLLHSGRQAWRRRPAGFERKRMVREAQSTRRLEASGPNAGSDHPTNSTCTRSGMSPAAWPRSSSSLDGLRGPAGRSPPSIG